MAVTSNWTTSLRHDLFKFLWQDLLFGEFPDPTPTIVREQRAHGRRRRIAPRRSDSTDTRLGPGSLLHRAREGRNVFRSLPIGLFQKEAKDESFPTTK
jgi:hypothetical protein